MDVSVGEARNRFSELLKRAVDGEEIVITSLGRAIATINKAKSRERVPGAARGLTKELDLDWWKPMTDGKSEAFYRGDY